jgi:hypothetical protein
MATVQFYGKDQVMQAAQNINCPAWAIYSGTALFMKWETNDKIASEQALEQALDMLCDSGTVAVYRIKFFEIPDNAERIKINEKTVCDGASFSFRTTPQEQAVQVQQMRIGYAKETNDKLDKLLQIVETQQQRLDELENCEDDEPEEKTIGSLVMGAVEEVIQDPNKLNQWIGVLKSLTGIGNNNLQQQNFSSMAIGNVTAGTKASTDQEETQEQMQARFERIYTAVEILEKFDPQLCEHLEKLAMMSQDNPAKLKGLLMML